MLITKKTQKKQTKLPVAYGPLKTGGGRKKTPREIGIDLNHVECFSLFQELLSSWGVEWSNSTRKFHLLKRFHFSPSLLTLLVSLFMSLIEPHRSAVRSDSLIPLSFNFINGGSLIINLCDTYV